MRIIILMLYAALGYAVYVFVRGYFSSVEEGRPRAKSGGKSEGGRMVECAECGAMVPESHSKNTVKSGETVYFCGDDCMGKFSES